MSSDAGRQSESLPVYQWMHQIDNTQKRIGSHQLLCMKLVVTQQYGGEQQLFSTNVDRLLNIFDFLKSATGSSEEALRVIVDLLKSCELQECESLLTNNYPGVYTVPAETAEFVQWNGGAKFARFLSSVYCVFNNQERKKFRAKVIHLLDQKNDSAEEELLKSIVQNNVDTELVKKAVISMTPKRTTKKKISGIFNENYGIELDFPKNPTRCFISCLAVLALLATPFIVSIFLISLLPTSYRNSFYAQPGVVGAVRQIDPFWYSSITITSSDVSVAAPLSCSQINTTTTSVHSSILALNRTGYIPFQELWNYGYLLKGSTLNLNITIIDPSFNGAAPILYQFNNYDQYNNIFEQPTYPPDQYNAGYPIRIAGSTNVSVDVNTDDAYFFALYLPGQAMFQYEFWLDKVQYNPGDYNFSCASPCQFSLPSSLTVGSNVQCILMMQTSIASFSDISTMINRNEFNILLYFPAIVVLPLLLTFALVSFCINACFYSKFRKDSNPSYKATHAV